MCMLCCSYCSYSPVYIFNGINVYRNCVLWCIIVSITIYTNVIVFCNTFFGVQYPD